jgi:hypothetical protein
MESKRFCSDSEAEALGFRGPEAQRRREVLRETLRAFAMCTPTDHYHRLADMNVARWSTRAQGPSRDLKVDVVQGDWGDVTRSQTMAHGVRFAVLNMANAYAPGGAYREGAIAQEENMFRRTDCHFSVRPDQLDEGGELYSSEMTELLSAGGGRVYLDVERPRVCIRSAEDRTSPELGYGWLEDSEIFPFYELRAAAQDLRDNRGFDVDEARKRIAAQLDTLRAHRLRHAILGAFGCGAFRNPAAIVARLYREEIEKRAHDFSIITFAIFSAGYGPDNYTPFKAVFTLSG